jgi:hypothetical protein
MMRETEKGGVWVFEIVVVRKKRENKMRERDIF